MLEEYTTTGEISLAERRTEVEALLNKLETDLPEGRDELNEYYAQNPEVLISILSLHRYLLHTDALTGLSNMIGAEKAYDGLKETVFEAENQETRVSLVAIAVDVNGFSKLNSGLSHDTGDLFLRNLAEALSRKFRDDSRSQQTVPNVDTRTMSVGMSDTAAIRSGGNEFIVILPLPVDSSLRPKDLESWRNDIINVFKVRIEEAFKIARQKTKVKLEEQALQKSVSSVENGINDEKILKKRRKEQQKKQQKKLTVIDDLSYSESLQVLEAKDLTDKSLNQIISILTKQLPARYSLSDIGASAVRFMHGLITPNSQADFEPPEILKTVYARRQRILYIEEELKNILARINSTRDIMEDKAFGGISISEQERELIIELDGLYKDAIDIDSVTGLKNRHWLERKLADIIGFDSSGTGLVETSTEKEDKSHYIKNYFFMIDMAHFGGVNEYNNSQTDAGDKILQKFSEILKDKCDALGREYGFIATAVKSGGDEFHIVLEGVDISLWLDESVDIENAEEKFKAILREEILEKAYIELVKFLELQPEMYPGLYLHTGKLTEIILPEKSTQNSSVGEIVRQLINLSEVQKDKSMFGDFIYNPTVLIYLGRKSLGK